MTDWLAAASDPRVVAVNRTRCVLQGPLMSHSAQAVRLMLHRAGIAATEDQAHALLDAVRGYDYEATPTASDRVTLDAAVTAIVGEKS